MTGAQSIEIRSLRADDWSQVEAIWAAGIAGGRATFEVSPPSWAQFDASRLAAHRFVAVHDRAVIGWAAVSPTSTRAAYAGVVEHSVYVHPDHHRRGVARALLQRLIDSTEAAGIWTIQSGIFPDNAASLALHRQLGFRTLGIRERVGRRNGAWTDVVLIERRSTVAGR